MKIPVTTVYKIMGCPTDRRLCSHACPCLKLSVEKDDHGNTSKGYAECSCFGGKQSLVADIQRCTPIGIRATGIPEVKIPGFNIYSDPGIMVFRSSACIDAEIGERAKDAKRKLDDIRDEVAEECLTVDPKERFISVKESLSKITEILTQASR